MILFERFLLWKLNYGTLYKHFYKKTNPNLSHENFIEAAKLFHDTTKIKVSMGHREAFFPKDLAEISEIHYKVNIIQKRLDSNVRIYI